MRKDRLLNLSESEVKIVVNEAVRRAKMLKEGFSSAKLQQLAAQHKGIRGTSYIGSAAIPIDKLTDDMIEDNVAQPKHNDIGIGFRDGTFVKIKPEAIRQVQAMANNFEVNADKTGRYSTPVNRYVPTGETSKWANATRNQLGYINHTKRCPDVYNDKQDNMRRDRMEAELRNDVRQRYNKRPLNEHIAGYQPYEDIPEDEYERDSLINSIISYFVKWGTSFYDISLDEFNGGKPVKYTFIPEKGIITATVADGTTVGSKGIDIEPFFTVQDLKDSIDSALTDLSKAAYDYLKRNPDQIMKESGERHEEMYGLQKGGGKYSLAYDAERKARQLGRLDQAEAFRDYAEDAYDDAFGFDMKTPDSNYSPSEKIRFGMKHGRPSLEKGSSTSTYRGDDELSKYGENTSHGSAFRKERNTFDKDAANLKAFPRMKVNKGVETYNKVRGRYKKD